MGAQKPLCYFVQRAVTTNRDNQIELFAGCTSRQFYSVAFVPGK
jgi:hypothetical protein